MIELKKALARVSVLTVLVYIVSRVLFRFFQDFSYSWIVLGILIFFNLIFMTLQFKRAIGFSSFGDLENSEKFGVLFQYGLNILILIIFLM